MADLGEHLGSPGDQTHQRQAAILNRHLPEGFSAGPDVSLGTQEAASSTSAAPAVGNDGEGYPFPSDGPTRSDSPSGTVPNPEPIEARDAPPNDISSESHSPSPVVATLETPDSMTGQGVDNVESSLKLQGGDIHRDIFKIKARANSLRRANTFSHQPSPRLQAANDLTYPEQREPGGFRRHYLRRQALQRRQTGPLMIAGSFVDFLDLYGSFAGEDLEESDSSEDESAVDDGEEAGEEQPLLSRPRLPRPRPSRRRSSRRVAREGDASTMKTFFTLLKAFIGTGIMFLPKAFRNGGILFSSLILVLVSLINCLCFRLLLDCREKYGGGYGELGAAIVGPRFRSLILASIALSQLGFVCAGLIFTAENLWAFLDAVTGGRHNVALGVTGLIALQLLPLIPLALIRHISKLGPVALIADVFILVGLVYIWYYDIAALSSRGLEPTVQLFNPSTWTLTIGSAIFTFEGIGLILPIQSSMKKPKEFGKLLYLVMFLITIIFTSVGALCYATFGEGTKIQVISNFPQDSPVVNGVQFLYSMAVLAGEPVQLFPAVRILETSIFSERLSGAKDVGIKWKKNALRTVVMVVCVGISILGATDLDKFVSLIGSFACVPLVYIYPAFLHYKGAAQSRWVKLLDIVLMAVGLIAMVYTTFMAVVQWVEG
ncbi:transmembrane amino acid transporter protein-domain-containing protein [Emericellopsis atlantica]|uniref:Transmembrane amino acid transporter protein-domain-containing protein n=1 Tax=Emericellopsis atlantica TaxID=2614577 RepID=A0A9P7ZPX7_9HYPO|nr:transmembrane amino acid transporter protein-domain-containing protein [Emericellopsis atlantica]KAG9256159.1 transmembrane amino acid transporter protein-domain-containing protein [Emericellopsis atlantica]